jgi:hypothetical protein
MQEAGVLSTAPRLLEFAKTDWLYTAIFKK